MVLESRVKVHNLAIAKTESTWATGNDAELPYRSPIRKTTVSVTTSLVKTVINSSGINNKISTPNRDPMYSMCHLMLGMDWLQ